MSLPTSNNYIVNYQPSSLGATCGYCKNKFIVNECRVGEMQMNWVNGRVGEAGSHIKYWHIQCFRLPKSLLLQDKLHKSTSSRPSRSAGELSHIKSRFQGYHQLNENDQKLIAIIMKNGKLDKDKSVTNTVPVIHHSIESNNSNDQKGSSDNQRANNKKSRGKSKVQSLMDTNLDNNNATNNDNSPNQIDAKEQDHNNKAPSNPSTTRVLQFENDSVIAWKSIITPNQPLKMHRHEYARVIVPLTDTKLKVINENGNIKYHHWKVGSAVYLEADPINELHADINESNKDMQIMVIQFKHNNNNNNNNNSNNNNNIHPLQQLSDTNAEQLLAQAYNNMHQTDNADMSNNHNNVIIQRNNKRSSGATTNNRKKQKN